jgi:tetratricopeptide (TPR) repeat protein
MQMTTCPSCESETLGGAYFCGFCAAPLPLSCSACELENPADARFCGSCGTPLRERLAVAAVPGQPSTMDVETLHSPDPRTEDDAPVDPPLESVQVLAAPADVPDEIVPAAVAEDPPDAVQVLEQAGDQAALADEHATAIDHFEEALRQLDDQNADQSVVARLEEKLGALLYVAGEYDEALEHLERAADTAHAERDWTGEGRITARMAEVHRSRGTAEDGIALVTPLLVSPMIDLLAWSGPTEVVASLHLALANLTLLAGRHRDTVAAAERAAEIARAIGNDRLLGEAEEKRVDALSALGQVEKARLALDSALPAIEAGGDLLVLARALTTAGDVARRSGDIAAGRRFTEQAIEVTERVTDCDRLVSNLMNLADVLLFLGDWNAAQDAIERSMALVVEGPSDLAVTAHLLAGRLALWRGNWVDAECRLLEAFTAASTIGNRPGVEAAQAYRAEIRLGLGRPREALDVLKSLAAGPNANLGLLLPVLARALLAAGDADAALETARQAVDSTFARQPLYLVDALRAQGQAMLQLGRSSGASMILEDGLSRARAMPYPYAEAHLLTDLGRWSEGLEIYRRLGAAKDIERLERELAAVE